ncbi:MAG TPA: hypothetical protein VFK02_30660 [Kofleriaceae bacterium]|nr:hypothetical protein [Kofleriaceae bacterium]
MTKLIALWIVLVAFAGAAFAQPASGSAAPTPAGASAPPAAADPAAPPPAAPAAPAAPGAPGDARKACTAAMNADPKFAAEIVRVADEKAAIERDKDTLATHQEAAQRVQKNERHVIYAYAAIWIVAAAFVIFLWRRQQALKTEIAHLRRDLEAAAGTTGGKT